MADRVFERQPFGTLSGSSFPVINAPSAASVSRYDICYSGGGQMQKESSSSAVRMRYVALQSVDNDGDTGQFVALTPDVVIVLRTSDTNTRNIGQEYDFDDANQRIGTAAPTAGNMAVTVVSDYVEVDDDGYYYYPCVVHCPVF